MDEEIGVLARCVLDRVYRRVRREMSMNPLRLGRVVGIGADGTPTKYIDMVAEESAIKALDDSELPVNLLSEEAGFIDRGGKYTFVLDPVDGTRNLCRGIPFAGISLAVGTSALSDVEYGLVRNIFSGDVFMAQKSKGSFLNNKRIVLPEVPEMERVLSIRLGRSVDARGLTLASNDTIRSFGSTALEMCLVANDGLDLYYWGRPSMRVVDIAAGVLIVREAGGVVCDERGDILDMPLSLDDRTSVVASCNKKIIDEVLSL